MSSMKIAKHIFPTLTIFSILFIFSGASFAAEKIFVKEYTYQASEIDSKVTSRVAWRRHLPPHLSPLP